MSSQMTTEETQDSSPSKPRKILFLDVDGVLNHSRTKMRCGPYLGVDIELGRRFRIWLEEHADVEIVLSSTWREDPMMQEHLKESGIRWIDCTAVNRKSRGEQIRDWLSGRPEAITYAIVDDITRWLPEQQSVVVITDPNKGITSKDLDRLSGILR